MKEMLQKVINDVSVTVLATALEHHPQSVHCRFTVTAVLIAIKT